ncbi:MAG: GyrI-like domain-containing protein, partial [Bacilli bacterium]
MEKQYYRKHEKEIYGPKNKPEIITIPKFKYFCIKGQGNPNNEDFKERIKVLYSLSYTLKMLPKKNYIPDSYFDYTIYPLEGLWDLNSEGRIKDLLDKDDL